MANVRSLTALADQLGTLYGLGAAGSLRDDVLVDRFLERNDPTASEAAFRALVDRHGAMVLSVCQQILQNPHDAHDAFQATFLVLVQRAESIRRRESVGGWLFGIARRVSARAHQQAARRRRAIESLRTLRILANEDSVDINASEPDLDDSPVLAEVDRLPEPLRVPVVLHYFEGLSTEAIGLRLGCPRGTVLSKLARARKQLRRRLERHGDSLEAVLVRSAASNPLLPNAPMPAALVENTVRAATCLSLAGTTIESVVPATVASLSRGMARNLLLAKVRLAFMLVILGAATTAVGVAMSVADVAKPPTNDGRAQPASSEAIGAQPTAPTKAANEADGEPVVIRGRVLDPDGKPLAGARIVLAVPVFPRRPTSRYLTATGGDGRFEAPIPRTLIEAPEIRDAWYGPVIGAWSTGLGPDWVTVDARIATKDLTFQLRRDDVPIEGRILDLQGRPVAGATVTAVKIAQYSPELLKSFRENHGVLWWDGIARASKPMLSGDDSLIPAVSSGADGRFRMTGIGRDRAVDIAVTGESIDGLAAYVITSSDPAYIPIAGENKSKLLGPRFDLVAEPGRAIEGVVRDRDSRRPIVGARISSYRIFWTNDSYYRSDAQGRFRMIGQPRGTGARLWLEVEQQPYIAEDVRTLEQTPHDPSGVEPAHVDVALKRGVWVEGKVVNRADGRPVSALVTYFPSRDNPHLKAWPDGAFAGDALFGNYAGFPTDVDGRFRAVALPGKGLLTVRTIAPGFLNADSLSPQATGNYVNTDFLKRNLKGDQAAVPIDLGESEKSVIPDIALVPGRTQHVQVVDPNGRPVSDLRVFGPLSDVSYGDKGRAVVGAEFTISLRKPGSVEEFEVVREDDRAGKLFQVKGDEPDPIRIRLVATGTVTGRLVDQESRPRPLVPIMVFQHSKTRPSWKSNFHFTDTQGRFQITGLVPDIGYSLTAAKNRESIGSFSDERYILNDRYRWVLKHQWAIKAGENQDWGDVHVKINNP
jgi:RNA polymerase sigma factor (sigma-70 family)